MLKSLPEHSSVGTDMLDSKVLGLAADYVYSPICHILNACLMKGVYPTIWKESKMIPLPKDGRLALTGKNSRPITKLPKSDDITIRAVHDIRNTHETIDRKITNFRQSTNQSK